MPAGAIVVPTTHRTIEVFASLIAALRSLGRCDGAMGKTKFPCVRSVSCLRQVDAAKDGALRERDCYSHFARFSPMNRVMQMTIVAAMTAG